MLFTSKVSAAYGKLTHSQKVVANYVDENYEDIAFSTLEELAEKTGLTPDQLSGELTMMELDGLIEARAGRAYALKR